MKFKALIFTLALGGLVFSQEKEASQAQSQLDSKQYTAAINTTKQVLNSNDISKIDPNTLRELYYVQGKAYMESGNSLDAAKSFVELDKLESHPVYYVKDKSTKEKSYFTDSSKAVKFAESVGGEVKEMTIEDKYSKLVQISLTGKLQSSVNQANAAYNAKNFSKAGDLFLETYYLNEALNLDGNAFLYYAAISKFQDKDNDGSKPLFEEIIEKQYQGEEPGDNYLEEAYRLLAYIQSENEDWESVIETAKAGLAKFPNNDELNSALSSAYNKTGNDDAFINQLKEKIQSDPNDAINYYNLGVLYTRKDSVEEAQSYFLKAIEKDPSYADAYQNLAMLYVNKDKAFKNEIDNLGTSSEDAAREDQINQERENMYKEMTPILEQAHQQLPDEKLYVQMLAIGYQVLGDNTNEKKYRTLLSSMQ